MDENQFRKMVNGITPDITEKRLKAIAASLPGSVRVQRNVYNGQQMKKKGFKLDAKGRPILDRGVYYMDEWVDIDIVSEISIAWEAGRDVALKEYLIWWLDNHNKMMKDKHLFDPRYKNKNRVLTQK